MFKEINYVLESHTYEIDKDGWYMEVRKIHDNSLDEDYWHGYIYENDGDPMFVIGEPTKQATLYTNWEEVETTLDDFLETMEFVLFDEDCNSVESYFEEYERYSEAIDESNHRMLEKRG